MRKDLRVGLGIGGVLLAVLVVAIIVRSHGKDKRIAKGDTAVQPETGDGTGEPTPPGDGRPSRSQYASRMSGPAQSFHPGASARMAKTSSGDAVDVASTKNAYSATDRKLQSPRAGVRRKSG